MIRVAGITLGLAMATLIGALALQELEVAPTPAPTGYHADQNGHLALDGQTLICTSDGVITQRLYHRHQLPVIAERCRAEVVMDEDGKPVNPWRVVVSAAR